MDKVRPKLLRTLTVSALLCSASLARPQASGRFDLTGPKIDVRVTRDGAALPIATVPNLQEGDQIWVHPDLPPTQSVHYLLVAIFLRGTTNPPPDEWFIRIETWNKKVIAEGVNITVPKDAQQAVLLLAPETGGDFSTLRSAVKGRPGIFVRASQDLAEAGFEQARIEKYLGEMKRVDATNAASVTDHSNLLARTLNLKPNPDCFKRPVDQQYNCLTQTGAQTLLDDGHGQSIVTALSNGPGSDFINQASTTSLAAGGMYSAYVGAIVDLVRLTSGLHTAQYQYIPAIAFPDSESLNLRLNTPPSFHNPKSVIVIGLPAVQKSILPPLRPADPGHISCLLQPKMVLPIEGAPLVFSTSFAHDMVLHIEPVGGKPQDLPLVSDAFQGGLTLAPAPPERKALPLAPVNGIPELPKTDASAKPDTAKPEGNGTVVMGTVKGMWGFDPFTGPTLPLQNQPGAGWKIVTTPQTPTVLIAGQPNKLLLASNGTACIESIGVEPGDLKADWKLTATDKKPSEPGAFEPRPVELTVNLQHATKPGNIQLAIQQFGQPQPDRLGTKTFSEPAKIEGVSFHTGDSSATLTGTSLDQVRQVTLNEVSFSPAPQAESSGRVLVVNLPQDAKAPTFKFGDKLTARISLKDDRILEVPVIVEGARPSVTILSRRINQPGPSPIMLSSPNDLPLGSQLIFFLKSPTKFPRNEQIEIADADGSLHTVLSIEKGTLVMQDAHTILATLDPLKTFGTSAFGPLRLRAVASDGTDGEWLPLATMVRLPTLDQLRCATDAAKPCTLSGSSLYLIDAVANDTAFTQPAVVPEGYVEPTLPVPHPVAGILYLRLRDDPESVQQFTLPILPAQDATTTARHTAPGGPNPVAPQAAKQ